MSGIDGIKWQPRARVLKYGPETVAEITKDIGHEPTGPDLRMLEARYGLKRDSVAEAEGNLLTTAGLNRITSLIIGGGQALVNNRSLGGVGVGLGHDRAVRVRR
ncbi:hypothetical protein ACIQBJ_14235 [Kitasatospora sp. NPDC088391]|uniref:hypothetical protein n=1 Tax=Kitasatospora sp. NPDC088391 TaxID=3364074 RepID=UPI003815AA2D